MNLKIELLGNSKIVDVFFFKNLIESDLESFDGESFSKYLLEKADYHSRLYSGFSNEGDFNLTITSPDGVIYDDDIYCCEGFGNESFEELNEAFKDEYDMSLDEVVSHNDWERKGLDFNLPDMSEFSSIIVRTIDLDGYNAEYTLNIEVDEDFKLSDLKSIVIDSDSGDCKTDLGVSLSEIISKEIETEYYGFSYKGKNYFIEDENYRSDFINEPYTFIGLIECSLYNRDGDEWSYDDDYYQLLGELAEIEE